MSVEAAKTAPSSSHSFNENTFWDPRMVTAVNSPMLITPPLSASALFDLKVEFSNTAMAPGFSFQSSPEDRTNTPPFVGRDVHIV